MTIQTRTAVRAAVAAALVGSLAPLAAPAAETESGGLEEVVVTAQFRAEKLQQTPIAISAFTAENIEQRGLANVTDLDSFVPNAVIVLQRQAQPDRLLRPGTGQSRRAAGIRRDVQAQFPLAGRPLAGLDQGGGGALSQPPPSAL